MNSVLSLGAKWPRPTIKQESWSAFIFFTDAVFAIVMTLLVLEIRVPEVPSDLATAEVPTKVLALWPKFFSYVLSFLVIGNHWIAHNQTFRYVMSYDRALLWMNLLFLLGISFIPFPTACLGTTASCASL